MELTKSSKKNLVILAVSQAIFVSATIMSFAFAGLIGKILASNTYNVTLPIACTGAGTLLLTFPASQLMKIMGRRYGFLIGSSCGIICGILGFVAISISSFFLFCIACAFMGIYQAFAQYLRFAAAEAVGKDFASNAISIVLIGGIFGAIIGPTIGTLTHKLLPIYHYAEVYLAISITSFLGILVTLMLKIPSQSLQQHYTSNKTNHNIKSFTQKNVFISISNMCIAYFLMILFMTATPLSMQHAGFDITHINLVIQWHLLGMYLPSLFTGKLIQRYGIKPIFYIGILFFIISFLFIFRGNSFIDFSLALILIGVGWNFMYISGTVLLVNTRNKNYSVIQGISEICVFSTSAISSYLAGFLLNIMSWHSMSALGLPFLLIAILLTLLYSTPPLEKL